MKYQVIKELLPMGKQFNRPLTTLSPQGLVIHETATPGATAQNERDYFAGGYRGGSAHYFVDADTTVQTIPENEQAWHAGPTANSRYLSVEMCDPDDAAKFMEVWNRTVWLAADACVRYGWNTADDVFSHRGISIEYHETNHTDPIAFLAKYGKTWEDLLAAIDAKIQELKGSNDVKLDYLVLYYGDADLQIAADLALNFKCPVIQAAYATAELLASAANKYQVGGGSAPVGVTLLGGGDRFDTMKAVLKAMGKV